MGLRFASGIRVDVPRHVQNVNAYDSRLKGWLRHFHGVSTRYQAEAADFQEVSINSTVAKAHACAAGAAKSCAENEALGRSRGGFSCKIHTVVDALGLPLKFILTGGQAADSTQAIPLEGVSAQACLADKGYDSDAFVAWLKDRGIKAVIPPKANRKEQRDGDYGHYKGRHAVECLFGKLNISVESPRAMKKKRLI